MIKNFCDVALIFKTKGTISKKELEADYIVNGLSTRDLSRKYSISRRTVVRYIKKYNIKQRTTKESAILYYSKNPGTFLGQHHSEGTKKKLSLIAKKQNKRPPIFRGPHSDDAKRKIGEYISRERIGEGNPNWKGGTSPINKRIRRSKKFKNWRKKVFERDNYACQMCGERGGRLHPHHIKSFAYYIKLRFDINNGITLCRKCHKSTENYGGKNIGIENN